MSKSRFRFEKDTHRYWDGERQIPSVTQMISAHGLLPDYEFATTEKGTEVHEATVWADDPLLVKKEPSSRIKKFLPSWERAKAEIGVDRWIAIEKPMFCEQVGFGWTADRIAWLKNRRPAIIEIKTGKEESGHYIQVAGYGYGFQLATEFDIATAVREQVERFLVYLDEDGFPRIRRQGHIREYMVRDLGVFLNAVSLTAWRIERGLFWKKEMVT